MARASTPSGPGLGFLGTVLDSEMHPGASYRIEHVLGQGGTAIAFFATRHSPTGESPAVVKVILPRIVMESGDHAITIVKKESVALGRLNERVPPTPFVVRLVDTGSVEVDYFSRKLALPWIALEYVHGGIEGTTLDQRVIYSVRTTGSAFDPARARRLIESLARGLEDIHDVGVVHRDLTPGNVLCCGSGETEIFKISDFGIAKPIGLQATFGDAIVGTPGYVAPEQIGGSGPVGPQSDIFSLASIVYFALAGQRYFDVTSPTQALVAAGTPTRKSLLESKTLSQELREREAACQAIDLALARATAPDAEARPKSAKHFAESLLPWIEDVSSSGKPSRRWITSMQLAAEAAADEMSSWVVRHPPGDDLVLTSVAGNASGHFLATSTRGLVYWDGLRWAQANTTGIDDPTRVRFVRRATASTWLLGGSAGLLAEYDRSGLQASLSGRHDHLTFTNAHGDLPDITVVIAEQAGQPPLLAALVGKRWLRPLPVPEAAVLTSLARIDDERWLVIGRATRGDAYAALYRPLDFAVEPIETPPCRALVACASRAERRLAVAVGMDGAVLRVERDRIERITVETKPDLASVAIDVLGNEWASAAGAVWGHRPRRSWKRVWHDPSWEPPFVGLLAEAGMILAVTVDGGVLESRAPVIGATHPGR